REPERRLVRLGHRRALVGAHVGALIGREHAALGPLDPSRRHLLAVDEEHAVAALSDAAAVIDELEADGRLTRWQRLRGRDGIPLQAEPAVGVRRLRSLM